MILLICLHIIRHHMKNLCMDRTAALNKVRSGAVTVVTCDLVRLVLLAAARVHGVDEV
jgi:hypothetical protein